MSNISNLIRASQLDSEVVAGHQERFLIDESEFSNYHPEGQVMTDLGFDTIEIVKMAVPDFDGRSDAHIEAALGEYLETLSSEKQEEFWGALIGKAAKIAIPLVKKFVVKNGGKLVNKIIKPKAKSALQNIGKTVSTGLKNPPMTGSGKARGKVATFISMIPQIIKMLNEIPDSSEAVSQVELLESLNELSESLEYAVEQLSTQSSEHQDLFRALANMEA